MKKILFLFFSFPLLVFPQNFLTTPDFFTSQCKQSDLDKINSGEKDLNEYFINSKNEQYWVVYSDRENNRLKNRANGSNNGSVLAYMEALYVKEVSGNWLHVYGYENEDEKGWIEAKYLLLSLYSLKTEGDVSVPRKAMVLTVLNNLVNGDLYLHQKHYYDNPSPQTGNIIRTPKRFDILFIMKEQEGSVLLSTTDVLRGPHIENSTKIIGWMPKVDIMKEWNSRIALEPSSSNNAIKEYSGKKLYGFENIYELEHYLESNFYNDKGLIEFEVGNKSFLIDGFRYALINSIDKNIKEVNYIFRVYDDSLRRNGSILDPGGCTEFYDDSISYYWAIRGFVALDYHGNGINALEPVILLTKKELKNLRRSLSKIIVGKHEWPQKELEKCLILIHKSILGQDVSTSSIENMTLNQFWQKIFGVDYYFKPLRDISLNDIGSITKKDFKRFYLEFETVARDFCNNSYSHTDKSKSRQMIINGDIFYWIPLEDLPGCKFVK